MTALEGMAVGVPVVMRINRAQYDAYSDAGAPPVCHAETAEDIIAALRALRTNPEHARNVSLDQRRWFMDYSGDARWPRAYRDILVALGTGHRFDFSRSPLCRPLGGDEREYHRVELAGAPTFPNYF
jgi:glycosyltransferase involved in cell wall biosynthesis